MKQNYYHFTSIDSTNSWVKRFIKKEEKEGNKMDLELTTLVTADLQTDGKGRYSREWSSSCVHNIYASLCFFPKVPLEKFGNIGQLLAIAIAEELIEYGVDAQLKWPNDVLINNKKIAGILCETSQVGKYWYLILGFGVNINMTLEQVKEVKSLEGSLAATSLFIELEKLGELEKLEEKVTPHKNKILQKICERFFAKLEIFLKKDFSYFLEYYQTLLMYKKGDEIQIKESGELYGGKFLFIDELGQLVLESKEAGIKYFNSGEIVLKY